MTQIYRHDLTVPETSLDENSHVNNLEYLRWIMDAAALHARTQGANDATRQAGATWVVRAHRIKYLRPSFAGEHLSVRTWVSDFRRVQSLRKYRIYRQEDNALLVAGEIDLVFVDASSGKLRTIPAEVMSSFEVLPKEEEKSVWKNPPFE